jgi:hypothetical protein
MNYGLVVNNAISSCLASIILPVQDKRSLDTEVNNVLSSYYTSSGTNAELNAARDVHDNKRP